MNLYQVCDKSYEWVCYAFDVSRSRAKMSVAESFGFDYIDARCKTLKKGVNRPYPSIVDDDTSEGYDIVLECGYRYWAEEELAEEVEKWLNEPFYEGKEK